MVIFGKQLKQENALLRARNAYLESLFTPEMYQSDVILARLQTVRQEESELMTLLEQMRQEIQQLTRIAQEKQAQIVTFDDEILVQEFGLYEPRYDLANSAAYKDRLKDIRERQRGRLKYLTLRSSQTSWAVNGSAAEGRKMAKDIEKLLYRAFNSECDEVISKVKYSNVQKSAEAIAREATTVTRLGQTLQISIDQQYYNLKIEELHLQFEYQQMKQKEKEDLRALKEQERDERTLRREIEAERKRLEKEQNHYERALAEILRRLEQGGDCVLLEKRAEIESHLADIDKAFKDVDYREANKRAGYVYVISNIGSFGEGIYKIGMTRRLDPQERIDELGDASVPFRYDVHAMIFCHDAPGLEAALHRAFENRKLNLINQRREFFKVSLEEIEKVVKSNFEGTAEFTRFADAEQYRASEKMREQTSGLQK
jgi:hypothetical protein